MKVCHSFLLFHLFVVVDVCQNNSHISSVTESANTVGYENPLGELAVYSIYFSVLVVGV